MQGDESERAPRILAATAFLTYLVQTVVKLSHRGFCAAQRFNTQSFSHQPYLYFESAFNFFYYDTIRTLKLDISSQTACPREMCAHGAVRHRRGGAIDKYSNEQRRALGDSLDWIYCTLN